MSTCACVRAFITPTKRVDVSKKYTSSREATLLPSSISVFKCTVFSNSKLAVDWYDSVLGDWCGIMPRASCRTNADGHCSYVCISCISSICYKSKELVCGLGHFKANYESFGYLLYYVQSYIPSPSLNILYKSSFLSAALFPICWKVPFALKQVEI